MAGMIRPVDPAELKIGQRIRIVASFEGVLSESRDVATDKLITLTLDDGEKRAVWCPRNAARVPGSGVRLVEVGTEPDPESAGAWFVRGPEEGPNLTDKSRWVYAGGGTFVCWSSGVADPPDGGTTFTVGQQRTLAQIWPINQVTS